MNQNLSSEKCSQVADRFEIRKSSQHLSFGANLSESQRESLSNNFLIAPKSRVQQITKTKQPSLLIAYAQLIKLIPFIKSALTERLMKRKKKM